MIRDDIMIEDKYHDHDGRRIMTSDRRQTTETSLTKDQNSAPREKANFTSTKFDGNFRMRLSRKYSAILASIIEMSRLKIILQIIKITKMNFLSQTDRAKKKKIYIYI